jgi:dephospho-CoA kinase
MIVIGITGGIGSGKSTVCKIFASLGIPVNDADASAKNIILNDEEVKNAIINEFGEQAYLLDGSYNRGYISTIVFSDKHKLEKLNAIVHPKVISNGKEWVEKHANSPYVIKEAALMFESGSYKLNTFNIVVESTLDLRIERICLRDKINREQAIQKIESQLSDEQRRSMADLIILNNEQDSLINQVYKIHQNIIHTNDPR